MKRNLCFVLLVLLVGSCGRTVETPADSHVVRCAVIGGMTMTGLWQEIAKMFQAQTGYRVEVVATGRVPSLTPPCAREKWICSRCTQVT